MATDIFSFKPVDVPQASRGRRRSRYAATVEAVYQFLQDHADSRSVKIDLGNVGVRSAVAGFRGAISKLHPDALRLVQRGGDLYIQRR